MGSYRQFRPKNPAAKEHLGLVDKVLTSKENWCILLLTDGLKMVVSANADSFEKGICYRFMGRWEENTYGPQFKVLTWVVDSPHSKAGVVKYLTDYCSGIGTKTAVALWEKYGSGCVDVLKKTPQLTVDDGVVKSLDVAREASVELSRIGSIENTKIDLFGLFGGRGFPSTLTDACIARYGVRAPRVITSDPFKLLTHRMPGCGFKRVDKLYMDLGGKEDSLKRQFLAGWNAIREDRTGSTWIPHSDCVESIKKLIKGEGKNPKKAIELGVRAGWLRVKDDGKWVASRERAKAEQRIVNSVARLNATRKGGWGVDIPVSQVEGDGLPSQHQADAVSLATRTAVGCLIGGPGTGKTHTLSYVLLSLLRRLCPENMAACAPTGKAAVRFTEAMSRLKIGIKATTIHGLLGVGGVGGESWSFEHNLDNQLSYQVYFVDETSMVGTSLMADLLDAIPDGSLVLCIGDPYQLPPVDHGAPLRDMLTAGVSTGELTEVRRNAGTIVKICQQIKNGERVEIADKLNLSAECPANQCFNECEDSEIMPEIEKVLMSLRKYDPVWECQIIVPLNEKSEVSRVKFNERLDKLLNPTGLRVAGCPFAVGAKVICRKSSNLRPVKPVSEYLDVDMRELAQNYRRIGNDPVRVANGEIGRVVAVGATECVFEFNGLLLVVSTKQKTTTADNEATEADAGISNFHLAYAITVHGSQGSEWPIVLSVVDRAGSMVADRNFWYTAISRAKVAGITFGNIDVFRQQCSRVSMNKRKTFLAELLYVQQGIVNNVTV